MKQPHATVYSGDYPSNPFTTALTGLKVFWQNSKSALPGVATIQFFSIMLLVLFLGIAIVGGVMLLLTWFVQASSTGQLSPETVSKFDAVIGNLPTEFINLANTSAYLPVTAGVLIAVGAVGIVLTATFSQALAAAISAGAVAHRQKVQFGKTIGLAFRRTWPLLGQGFLVLLGVLTLTVVPGIIFGLLGQLSPLFIGLGGLYYLTLIGGLIYAMLRLSMASVAIVVDGMGPVEALKYSWRITNKHVGEIIGVLCVISAATTVITMVFNLASYAFSVVPTISAIIEFISFVVVVLASLVTMSAYVERYVQLSNADRTQLKGHTTDWNSNIAAIGIFVGINTLYGLVDATINPVTPVMPEPSAPDINLQST